MSVQFTWIPFYKEFATKLLDYKNKREELIKKIRQVHDDAQEDLPSIETDNDNITNIDPFTVFALFNRGNITKKRHNLVGQIKIVFDIKADIPTDYDGIPTQRYDQYCFYHYSNHEKRREDAFDILWGLFEFALKYSENSDDKNKQKFLQSYEQSLQLPLVAESKLTKALFQIRPETFLSLDENCKAYFKQVFGDKVSSKVFSAKNYLDIVQAAREEIIKNTEYNVEYPFAKFSINSYNEISKDNKIKKLNIWKVSHGTKVIKSSEISLFERDSVAVIHKDTGKIARSKKSQGEQWKNDVHAGDFCYLCYSNDVKFLAKFVDDNTTECTIKGSGWLQRKYKVIKKANDIGPFKGAQKRWLPNFDSTLYKVKSDELSEFEELILQPYFNMTLADLIDSEGKEEIEENVDSVCAEGGFSKNRIIFGAPGTGKSYKLKQDGARLLGVKMVEQTENTYDNYDTVTFHPESTYAQFIGTYKPAPSDNDSNIITYKYVPGPFMRMYVKAKKFPERKFLLIIEEINRANAAAVFGDIFQLLDRNAAGESEYSIIASEDLKRYLKEQFKETDIDCERIRIPENMYLWATMNSADQGVYPMDTAFKRRWDFEYIDIDSNELNIVNKEFTIGEDKINWNKLRHAINDCLTDHNINEDKLLGPYFVSEEIMRSDEKFVSVFKNKVLMYLFEDAARQHRSAIFAESSNRFSSVLMAFEKSGIYAFSEDIVSRYKELTGTGSEFAEE